MVAGKAPAVQGTEPVVTRPDSVFEVRVDNPIAIVRLVRLVQLPNSIWDSVGECWNKKEYTVVFSKGLISWLKFSSNLTRTMISSACHVILQLFMTSTVCRQFASIKDTWPLKVYSPSFILQVRRTTEGTENRVLCGATILVELLIPDNKSTHTVNWKLETDS